MTGDDATAEEFVRFRAKVQLGDGPDQRGTIEVEVQKDTSEDDRDTRFVTMPEAVTDEAPAMDVEGETNDAAFAEFYHELNRGRRALTEALGLEEDE